MFDIGLSEILIVAIVALVVLGPERLPKAARLAGFWVRKARAQWYTVKAELESEMADEELRSSLKESMTDLQQTLNAHQEDLRNEMQSVDAEIRETMRDVKQHLPHEMQASNTDLFSEQENKTNTGLATTPDDTESKPKP
jgi:sec-independent protein translocase protein TatB